MNTKTYKCETKKTNIRSTVFSDGMIVTADDLGTAMRFPLELLQVLVKAHFGCGVVCGLRLHQEPEKEIDTFCVKVEPGVALNHHGHPLQLCEAVTLDLRPDPCDCDPPPKELCIAIGRVPIPESCGDDGDDCDDKGQPRCQHRRLREGVCVAAFVPDDISGVAICQRPEKYDWSDKPCPCLKECPDCECCCESWVLLGCVTLVDDRITKVDRHRRKYVKPVECHCEPDMDDYWSKENKNSGGKRSKGGKQTKSAGDST